MPVRVGQEVQTLPWGDRVASRVAPLIDGTALARPVGGTPWTGQIGMGRRRPLLVVAMWATSVTRTRTRKAVRVAASSWRPHWRERL